MLTKSGVKLVDFGLAKFKATGPAAVFSGVTALPTQAPDLTAEGTVLGTFQYMAPEQLEGSEAGARTDIFALGTVLYEMTTGQKAFSGKGQASLISAIMSAEPQPISAIQPMAPPALERVVRTCLAKDPDDRWQTAHDVMLELKWIAEAGSQAGIPAPVISRRKGRERIAWAAAAVGILAALALALYAARRPIPERRTIRAYIPAPRDTVFAFEGPGAGSLTVSPDGKYLTFTAAGADGVSRLWVRPLQALAAEPLPGTDHAQYPFWSPDSRFIAFFANRKLKKISVSGGAAVEICDASTDPRGGTWNSEGVILFAPHWREVIHQVSADGGAARPVTKMDEKRRETTHRWPHFLPDGRHFLYLGGSHLADPTSGENAIFVGSLDSPERRLLVNARSNVLYASGRLLFLRGRSLVAQRFDPEKRVLVGEAVPVAEGVRYEQGFFQGIFSASKNGVLAYQQGESASKSRLVWFDRSGKEISTLGDPGEYFDVRLSPDGKIVAVVTGDPSDIWLYDLARGIRTRFTFDPLNEASPIWSADGRFLAYSSDRKVHVDIFRKAVSGAGGEEPVAQQPANEFPWDWSADGRFLAYEHEEPGGTAKGDLWIMPISGDRKPFPYLATPFAESQAQFSPDGRWLAYVSDESGRNEVYVSSFPEHQGKWQLSNAGGSAPRWRRDGRELFYVSADRRLAAVEVRAGAVFEAGAPRPLFSTQIRGLPGYSFGSLYDVSVDGQRFLVNTAMAPLRPEPVTLVLDWTAELKSR